MIPRYADIDNEKRLSVLPPLVQRGLVRLGEDIRDGRLDRENLKAVLDRLSRLPLVAVIQTDREVRYRTALFEYEQYTTLSMLNGVLGRKPGHLLKRVEELGYIFACHGNGYLREAALKRLAAPIPSAFLFALVACQLNNWVPQVRQAARDCLERVIPLSDSKLVAEAAMYLLQTRGFWARGQAEHEILDTVLVQADLRQPLVELLVASRDGAPHRSLIASLVRPEMDAYLLRLMNEAMHPEVRAIAARTLISGVARWPTGRGRAWIDKSMGLYRLVTLFAERHLDQARDIDALITQAASDRAVQVRKVAMQALIDAPDRWGPRKALIDQMARDRSHAVRTGIDYILRHR